MNDTAIDQARRLLIGFALTLRETRRHAGYTLRELGQILDIPFSRLSWIETGKWVPDPDDHAKLTEWLLKHPLPSQTTPDQSVCADTSPTAF